MEEPVTDDLARQVHRTLAELRQGRDDLRERVPREVYETYSGRYAQLMRNVERLIDEVQSGALTETEARDRLRGLRRRAAQLEATSVTSSMGFGPMGPLIRLITIVRDRLLPSRR